MQRVSFISLYDEFCLNLRYASSMLRHDGHQTFITLFKGVHSFDTQPVCQDSSGYYGARTSASPREISLLLHALKHQNLDLIALFFSSACYELANFLTKFIKTELEVPILWAGVDTTFNPVENIHHADMVCLGEAEYPIRFLVEAMDKGQDYSSIHSLWVRRRDRIQKNPAMGLETNLDKLPWPDFDPQNKTVIAIDEILSALCPPVSPLRTNVPIIASRVCPFTCPYCKTAHDGIVYAKHESTRVRSVDSVVEELKHRLRAWSWPVERIEFHDESFPLETNWLEEFTERYPTEIALPFFGFIRPNDADTDVYRMLRQAGMFSLILRIPSGSQTILNDIFHRNESREQILHTARAISGSGIKLLCELTIDNPFESEEDRRETLKLLCEFPAGFGVIDNVPFAFYENCELTQTAKKRECMHAFERPAGEHALSGKPNSEHLFWDCVFKLTQFEGVDKPDLCDFVSDDYLRKNPAALREIVDNLYQTTYVDGNPMAEKDRFVRYLRTRLTETQTLASHPAYQNIHKLIQTLKPAR